MHGYTNKDKSYDDVAKDIAARYDKQRSHLVSTLFLTNPRDDNNPLRVQRGDVVATGPYTALNQTEGTSVTLWGHRGNKHESFLTPDSLDDVNGLLDGRLHDKAKQYMLNDMIRIRKDEHREVQQRFSSLYRDKTITNDHDKNGKNNALDRSIGEQGRLHQNAQYQLSQKGMFSGGKAALRKAIQGHGEEIDRLESQKSEIENQANESAQVLKQEYDEAIAAINHAFSQKLQTDYITNESAEMEKAFELSMLLYKQKDDNTDPNTSISGQTSQKADDTDPIFERELSYLSGREPKEQKLQRDMSEEELEAYRQDRLKEIDARYGLQERAHERSAYDRETTYDLNHDTSMDSGELERQEELERELQDTEWACIVQIQHQRVQEIEKERLRREFEMEWEPRQRFGQQRNRGQDWGMER